MTSGLKTWLFAACAVAGFACTGLSDYDPQRPVEDRVLSRYTDETENLRYILLRFTGIEGVDADVYVERLRTVYRAGKTGARGERGGGEAVCIALLASPEFLTY